MVQVLVQVLVHVLVQGLSSSDFGSGFGSGNLFRCWTTGQAVWAWHAGRAGRASMACMAEWAGSGVCMHVLIVNAMADTSRWPNPTHLELNRPKQRCACCVPSACWLRCQIDPVGHSSLQTIAHARAHRFLICCLRLDSHRALEHVLDITSATTVPATALHIFICRTTPLM